MSLQEGTCKQTCCLLDASSPTDTASCCQLCLIVTRIPLSRCSHTHPAEAAYEPWTPTTGTAFKALLSARLCAAIWSHITDCDETFNYWEPVGVPEMFSVWICELLFCSMRWIMSGGFLTAFLSLEVTHFLFHASVAFPAPRERIPDVGIFACVRNQIVRLPLGSRSALEILQHHIPGWQGNESLVLKLTRNQDEKDSCHISEQQQQSWVFFAISDSAVLLYPMFVGVLLFLVWNLLLSVRIWIAEWRRCWSEMYKCFLPLLYWVFSLQWRVQTVWKSCWATFADVSHLCCGDVYLLFGVVAIVIRNVHDTNG